MTPELRGMLCKNLPIYSFGRIEEGDECGE